MLEVVHKNFGKKDSDESKAAEILTRKLRDIKANGSILVISNLSLPGGELVKDIDIAVVGYLQDYIIHHRRSRPRGSRIPWSAPRRRPGLEQDHGPCAHALRAHLFALFRDPRSAQE